MQNPDLVKSIAWISIPAFVSTDRFIIPELAKHYRIDYYILKRFNEEIDFLDTLEEYAEHQTFNLKVVNINLRLSDPRIIGSYIDLIKKIKKKQYDLIYSIMIGIPYYMVVLRILLGNQNVLVGIHNVHVPKGGTMYLPSKIYNSFTIRGFRYFQTFSESQKEELLKFASKKYCGSVNFVLMDYGQPTIKRRDHRITFLSFGYIREYKRVDVLIQAAQLACQRTGKRFRVIIAGNCENWEPYSRLITEPELFDLRLRRIEDSEVANLFAESDYFVAAYQDIAQSGSAIIAMNYNLPIIASKLKPFEDYIEEGKTGVLVEPASIEDLADKMVYLIENHDALYAKMQQNIEIEKNNLFSPESVARSYVNNFEMVFNHPIIKKGGAT